MAYIVADIGQLRIKCVVCFFVDVRYSCVGQLLDAHYASTELARALVELGDIQVLSEAIRPPPGARHDRSARQEGVTWTRRDMDEPETSFECERILLDERYAPFRSNDVYFYDVDGWAVKPAGRDYFMPVKAHLVELRLKQ